MINIYREYFIYNVLLITIPILFLLILFYLSTCNEYVDIDYKIGWNKINKIKRIEYGRLCTSKLVNSTYYELPGVCSLKCDLIPVLFPSKSSEKCKNQRKMIEIQNSTIIALEDVNITFSNTYYSNSRRNNKIAKYLKKGKTNKIKYEQIEIKSKDVADTFLHFIPTKLNVNQSKVKQYNINMYFFDGLSRSVFNEEMNDTISYLNSIIDDFDIFEFFRYHTLGQNSEANWLSIFYRTTKNRAFWLNEKDDIFMKIYKRKYKTLVFDPFRDRKNNFYHPHINHKGFDHEYHLMNKLAYTGKPKCIGSKQIHQHYFKFQEEAMKYYHKHNQLIFSINTFCESHDPNLISLTRVDKDFANHLKEIKEVMKDSITVIIGDHGIHYGRLWRTEYGENDRALPVMIIIVPKSFSQSFPSIYRNMRINQNRFSTHLEFHETLNDIIRMNEGDYEENKKYSLFREIPKSYSCDKAKVDFYCACR